MQRARVHAPQWQVSGLDKIRWVGTIVPQILVALPTYVSATRDTVARWQWGSTLTPPPHENERIEGRRKHLNECNMQASGSSIQRAN